MTSAWQSCQGDYKPAQLFIRDNQTVIVRNIKETDEEGVYQWEEYAMLTEDYESVIASTTALSHQIEQNTADIDYIATMADIEL